jgi:TonB family protein
MIRHYPARAAFLGVTGAAIVACNVDVAGRLQNCAVVFEQPIGRGFGEAALAMTPEFRMRPATLGGRPVDGVVVRFPVVFHGSAQIEGEIGRFEVSQALRDRSPLPGAPDGAPITPEGCPPEPAR